MSNKFVKISDSEYEVMEVIWEKGETGVSEVHKILSQKHTWAYNTVATFIQRLAEKGFIEIQKNGKANICRAVISKEEYKKSMTKDFLDSIHNGSKRSLIASLFDKQLPDDTIDKLMRLIDEE